MIQLKISNKTMYTFLTILFISIIAVVVIASGPINPGHLSDEVWVTNQSGVAKTLQQAIDDGDFSPTVYIDPSMPITGSCNPGYVMSGVNADGEVMCIQDQTGASSINMGCVTVRRFKDPDTALSITSRVGEEVSGIAASSVAEFVENRNDIIPGKTTTFFGFQCKSGWVLTGCAGTGWNLGDSDEAIIDNGCYKDIADGYTTATTFLDMVCCRISTS